MACQSCEERRKKIKAMYDNSKESIANAIARITDRNRKAKQSSDSTEQSVNTTDISAEQPDQRVVVNARRTRGPKQS